MCTSRVFAIILPMLPMIAAGRGFAQDSTLSIVIVAGQSNALNWHADAALLAPSVADSSILFYYHTGLPPSKSPSDPFNATSDSQWTTLTHQTQRPYKLHHENFFGPEMSLARELSTVIPRLAVIKCVYAGSTLAYDWKKGSPAGNKLYELMMSQIGIAQRLLDSAGVAFAFAGLFWMQGESDAASTGTASSYESNLVQFIADVRTDLGAPNLRCVIGRIGAGLPAPYAYTPVVREAQMSVAQADPAVTWVDIDDLPFDADSVHLLAEGVYTLGARMAHSWTSSSTNIISEDAPHAPSQSQLYAYPNPFNAATTISFQLTRRSPVTLTVHTLLGSEVAVLLSDDLAAGEHISRWSPGLHPSGMYFFRLRTNSGTVTRRIVLLK